MFGVEGFDEYMHWSLLLQELLMERLKKHGVDSPFVMFMKSEVSKMSECLQVIHDDLKVC